MTTFRRATFDDVELLAAWHADPEVSRYWDDETFTADELRKHLERVDVDSWIVVEGGEPVGYLASPGGRRESRGGAASTGSSSRMRRVAA